MNRLKTHKRSWLLTGVLSFGALCAMAEDVTLVSCHSEIYNMLGEDQVMTMVVASDMDTKVKVVTASGSTEYEVKVGEDTTIPVLPGESGDVQLIGDPDHLYALEVSGGCLTEIDLSKWKKIAHLSLPHNYLTGIDLRRQKDLQAVDISDNPFEVDKTHFGTNHPELQILTMSSIDTWPSTGVAVENFPKLQSFIAFGTHGFKSLDFSNCTQIKQISIDSTDVTDLTLTQANSQIRILNIGSIPFSNFEWFPQLAELYISGATGDISFSANPELYILAIQYGSMTSLDITGNPKMRSLFADYNRLTSLDISNNPDLIELRLRHNAFTFATLPIPDHDMVVYEFEYQEPLSLGTDEIAVQTQINLSDKVLREGSVTTCSAFYTDPKLPGEEHALREGLDYIYDNGVVTPLRRQNFPVTFRFANSEFPTDGNLGTLTTTPVYVLNQDEIGKGAAVMTFMPSGNEDFSARVTIADSYGNPIAAQIGVKIGVDWGMGDGVEYQDYAPGAVISHAPTYRVATLYVPRNLNVNAFELISGEITTLDVTNLYELQTLNLDNSKLAQIDLKWNKALRTLSMRDCDLTYLDLEAGQYMFTKNDLQNIDLAGNRISALIWDNKAQTINLDLSRNELSDIDLSTATLLKTLNIADNKLTEINLSNCAELTSLNIARNNGISALELPNENWTSLDISGNAFDFASMPHYVGQSSTAQYVYAPQAPIKLGLKGPAVNLNSQYFKETRFDAASGTYKEYTTEYKWFRADGSVLPASAYTETEGRFVFTDPASLGKVYCEVYNGAYPDFSGEDALTTTIFEGATVPSEPVASLVASAQCNASMLALSDKQGAMIMVRVNDGDMVYYDLGDSYLNTQRLALSLKAGDTVKIYEYSDSPGCEKLYVDEFPLGSVDLSGMSQLNTLALRKCGLNSIDLSAIAQNLTSLDLDNNNFETFDASIFPNLKSLAMLNNKLTSVNLDNLGNLQSLWLDNNRLTEIDLSQMPALESLSAGINNIGQIDLSNLPLLHQLNLSSNWLQNIDFSKNYSLRVIYITGNLLTFATLPLPNDQWTVYSYNYQSMLTPQVADGKTIDLSSQLTAYGVPTKYTWYDRRWAYAEDDWEVFDENEQHIAPLVEGVDYTISEGVTTFLKSYDEAYCLMTNTALPKLGLVAFADHVTASLQGIADSADGLVVTVSDASLEVSGKAGALVGVFDINGRVAAHGSLGCDGKFVSAPLASGVYLVTVGSDVVKVIVR